MNRSRSSSRRYGRRAAAGNNTDTIPSTQVPSNAASQIKQRQPRHLIHLTHLQPDGNRQRRDEQHTSQRGDRDPVLHHEVTNDVPRSAKKRATCPQLRLRLAATLNAARPATPSMVTNATIARHRRENDRTVSRTGTSQAPPCAHRLHAADETIRCALGEILFQLRHQDGPLAGLSANQVGENRCWRNRRHDHAHLRELLRLARSSARYEIHR